MNLFWWADPLFFEIAVETCNLGKKEKKEQTQGDDNKNGYSCQKLFSAGR